MNSDQETSGFLPPINTGFTNELRRLPSSSTTTLTGNNPRLPPHFIKLNISPTDTVAQDSHLAADPGRAIFTTPSTSFRDLVAASPTVDTHRAISPTVSDITTSPDQQHTTITSTPPKGSEPPRRNPLRRTLSDTISTVRKPTAMSPISRTTPSWCSIGKESPQFKRQKKAGEMETEFEKKCWGVRSESGVTEGDVEDDKPSEAIVEQDEDGKEARGEEFVGLRRLDDGSLSIKLSCSCGNCFELLRKRTGPCFYRLKIDKASVDVDPFNN